MGMKELVSMIGRRGMLRCDGLVVEVNILDVKESYGQVRYLVSPVAGACEKWVNDTSLESTYPAPIASGAAL